MNQKFHSTHGGSVIVDESGRTANRINPDIATNGVVFMAEPLAEGERFQVKLDETSADHEQGGIDIGVTSNNPANFTIPGTMTECQENVTYVISGKSVYLNSNKIQDLDTGLESVKQGDKVGVQFDSNVGLQLFLNSRYIACIRAEVTDDLWGFVDLSSKVRVVSIVETSVEERRSGDGIFLPSRQCIRLEGEEGEEGQAIGGGGGGGWGIASLLGGQHRPVSSLATAEVDVKESVSLLLELLMVQTTENADMVCTVTQSLRKLDRKHQPELAEELLKHDAATTLTSYLHFCRQNRRKKLITTAIQLILHMIWPLCDKSVQLSEAVGRAGIFEICAQELAMDPDIGDQQVIIRFVFHLVHNAVKCCPQNVPLLRKVNFIKVAEPFADELLYKQDFVIIVVLAMSYVIEENETHLVQLSEDGCKSLVELVKQAIASDRHHFDGWSVSELCMGLANLAANPQNVQHIVYWGGHVYFARLLMFGNSSEQEHAVRALQAYTCRRSYRLISKVPKMLELLRDVKPDWTEPTKEMAADILQQLENYIAEKRAQQHTIPVAIEESVVAKEEPEDLPAPNDAVISDDKLTDMLATLPSTSKPPQCSYHAACLEFIESLQLQRAYFDPEADRCFCLDCHAAGQFKDYAERGKPPRKYSLPLRWCRFGLRTPPKAKALKVISRWHKAFHGTKLRFLSKILNVGELAVPGHDVLGGELIFERSVRIDGKLIPQGPSNLQIFLSPSIHYAGSDAYTAPEQFTSPSSGMTYAVRLAYEVFIDPRAYVMRRQTIGAVGPIDPEISNDVIEWSTAQMGSTVLYGVLVNMEKRAEETGIPLD